MSEEELTIRRILVALDASTHSLAALQAAADLAARLQAELLGLFVEDENLLHLAGLPFAHELQSPAATRRPMSSERMAQDLHLQAQQARRALAAAAERAQVRWSFQIVRGQVTPAVLQAALEVDLLALGRVSRPLSRRRKLGSTARAATAETKRAVLLMQHGGNLSYPVLVTYDGTPAGRQALLAAGQLARAGGDHLNVLLLGDSADTLRQLQEEADAWLARRGLAGRYLWLPEARVESLITLVQKAGPCVLVLGGENPLLAADSIQTLLDQTDCPVLLVR